jgi:uncharacterized protein YkwD
MISSFITCTLMITAGAGTTNTTETHTAAKAAKLETTAAATSQPQTQTVNKPITEPAKTEPAKTETKTESTKTEAGKTESAPVATTAKFEILAVEQSIVDLTNAERARFGLPALAIDPNLMNSARRHGNWMASYRQMVHSHMNVAENIAMGQANSQDVLRTWMNSSGHRANILGGYRRIGVSAYRSPEGTIFWCQQFSP